MASLTGNTIQSTYDSLLKVTDNDSITGSLKRITDGLGNNTPLYLSSSAVEIVSTLNVTSTITASNLSGTNTGDETKASIETKLGAATSSNSGYLTSTDWSTFNNKIAGTGTLNKLAKFSSSSSIADSTITDTGSAVTIGVATSVTGSLTASSLIRTGGTSSQFLKADGSVDSTSYTPTSRTLTINGTSYDLSADRSWTISPSQWITSGSNIYYSAGNVAIGTSSPDSLLHLQSSTVDTRINLNAGSSSYTPYIMFKSVGVNKATIGLGQYNGGSLNNLLLYCDSGDTIFANSSERMRIINTGQLKLNGYTTTTSFSGTAAGYLAFDSSGNIITTATPSTSQWITSGSNIYYNTGNVGIGTTSPVDTLDLGATINQTVSVKSSTSNRAYYGAWTDFALIGVNRNPANGVFADTGKAAADISLASSNGNSSIRFGTTSSNNSIPSERMRITSGGSMLLGDAVAPNEVYWFGTAVFGKSGTAKVITGYLTGATNGAIIGSHNSALNDWDELNIAGTNLIFRSGGQTERVRITSGGNVGIGTTSPANLLTVRGNGNNMLSVQYNSDGGAAGIGFLNSSGTELFSIGGGRFQRQDELSISRQGTSVIYVNNSNNVGIGTTSPARLLHASASYSAPTGGIDSNIQILASNTSGFSGIGLLSSNTASTFIHFGDTDSSTVGQIVYGHDDNRMQFNTAGSERMRITSGGNVGIGTTTFTYAGATFRAAIGSSDSRVITFNGSNNSSVWWAGSGSPQFAIDSISGGGATFWTNNGSWSERMRIDSGGYVMIGGTSTYNNSRVNIEVGTDQSGITTNVNSSDNRYHLSFRNTLSTVGSISTNTYATSFNTSSDYRLKEDLKPFNGLSILKDIKVYDFKWKGVEDRNYGVVAHEIAEVIPYAVNGEKDGEMHQSVDYSKLVPVLIQAIQELKAELDELKNK